MRNTYLSGMNDGQTYDAIVCEYSRYIGQTNTGEAVRRRTFVDVTRKCVRENLQRGAAKATFARLSKNVCRRFEGTPYDGYANDVLHDVFSRTQRLTLYTEHTGFAELVEQCANDLALAVHQKAVFEVYLEYFGDNTFATAVLRSENAAPWLEFNGYEAVSGQIARSDEVESCDECNARMLAHNVFSLQDGDGDEHARVCHGCVQNRSFFCEVSNRRFDNEICDRSETDEGQSFCIEYCLENNLVEEREDEDADGDLITTYHVVRAAQTISYHSARREWRHQMLRVPERAIGVELEVGFADGTEGRERFIRENLNSYGRMANGLPFCAESDSSLSAVFGGYEIISEPLLFHEGYVAENAPWRQMLSILKTYGAEGWRWREYAGIHVNMDARHLSDNDIVKYAVFVSNAAALSKFIAGRKKIYNGGDAHTGRMYSGGYNEKVRNQFIRRSAAERRQLVFSGQGKYAPVHMRSGSSSQHPCLETRIFGSNVKYEGFMACVEYCLAASTYVQTLDFDDVFSPLVSSLFRAWLYTQTKRFPNLCARLGIVAPSKKLEVAKIIPIHAVA